MAKRARRSTEQLIQDLQHKIEQLKARAARAKAKKDPALRHVHAAVRSIDKAAKGAGDAAIRKALHEARATLVACLELRGAAVPAAARAPRGPRAASRRRIEPAAVLAYLAAHPSSNGEELAKALGTDTQALRPVLKELIDAGEVKAKGRARGTRYSAA